VGNLIIVLVRMLGSFLRPRTPPAGGKLLWILAALMILVIAPDVIAAIEFTTLLDVLGAALFWIAFMAGAQLLAIRAGELLRLVLLPEWDWLIQIPSVPAKSAAVLWMARNSVIWLLPAIALREAARAFL
jgi:hypothetical protein